jgi:hypothetical protein
MRAHATQGSMTNVQHRIENKTFGPAPIGPLHPKGASRASTHTRAGSARSSEKRHEMRVAVELMGVACKEEALVCKRKHTALDVTDTSTSRLQSRPRGKTESWDGVDAVNSGAEKHTDEENKTWLGKTSHTCTQELELTKGLRDKKGTVSSNIEEELFQGAMRASQSPQEALDGDRAILVNAADSVEQNKDESASATECSGEGGSELNTKADRFKPELGRISARKGLSKGESQSKQLMMKEPETRVQIDWQE